MRNASISPISRRQVFGIAGDEVAQLLQQARRDRVRGAALHAVHDAMTRRPDRPESERPVDPVDESLGQRGVVGDAGQPDFLMGSFAGDERQDRFARFVPVDVAMGNPVPIFIIAV